MVEKKLKDDRVQVQEEEREVRRRVG